MKTVLVVDDDTKLRNGAVRALRAAWRVVTAADAREALAIARHETIDVAVIDVVLRGESGIELLTQLKKLQPDLMTIVMSGLGCANVVRSAFHAGATDFFDKPFEWCAVVARFERGYEASADAAKIPPFQLVKLEYYNQLVLAFGGNVSRAARYAGIRRTSLQRIRRRRAT